MRELISSTLCLVAAVSVLACNGCNGQDTPGPGDQDLQGLRITDSAARSCEVVVSDPGHRLAEIVFGDSVDGRFRREGTRVAASFYTRSDAAIADGAVGIELSAGASLGDVEVELSRCFDRAGGELAGAAVEVQ